MSLLWKRVVPVVLLLSLAGPAFLPGLNLYQLYTTGETDDYGEFCNDVDAPRFVLGAARTCDLDLRQVGLFAAFAYLTAIPPAAIAAVLLTGAFSLRRRRP
ncbi:MAG: hypothetical protein VW600_01840 [Ferrovibrio sp.]